MRCNKFVCNDVLKKKLMWNPKINICVIEQNIYAMIHCPKNTLQIHL